MDSDNELARAKWLMASAAVFLMSACLSWGEAVYLVAGRDATADVVKDYQVTRRGRFGLGGREKRVIDYAFSETDGSRRKGTDTVSPDWPLPAGGKVAVRYTAGAEGDSRLAGHVNWLGLTLFALSLGSVGLFGFRLYREASEATNGRKPGRR